MESIAEYFMLAGIVSYVIGWIGFVIHVFIMMSFWVEKYPLYIFELSMNGYDDLANELKYYKEDKNSGKEILRNSSEQAIINSLNIYFTKLELFDENTTLYRLQVFWKRFLLLKKCSFISVIVGFLMWMIASYFYDEGIEISFFILGTLFICSCFLFYTMFYRTVKKYTKKRIIDEYNKEKAKLLQKEKKYKIVSIIFVLIMVSPFLISIIFKIIDFFHSR